MMTEQIIGKINGNIQIPFDMIIDTMQIFEGCYDIQDEIKSVVDIGACVGMFSLWAWHRFNEPEIIAYEPIETNFQILKENLAFIPNAKIENMAVGDVDVLYWDQFNRGRWGKYCPQGHGIATVKKIEAILIPSADLLKIDTEGMEIEILEKINPGRFKYIVLEYHTKEDMEKGEKLLDKDFIRLHGWWADYSDGSGRGIFRYGKRNTHISI